MPCINAAKKFEGFYKTFEQLMSILMLYAIQSVRVIGYWEHWRLPLTKNVLGVEGFIFRHSIVFCESDDVTAAIWTVAGSCGSAVANMLIYHPNVCEFDFFSEQIWKIDVGSQVDPA